MIALDVRLASALTSQAGDLPRLCSASPADRAERFRTLVVIYRALSGAVADNSGPQARLVTHPAIAGLKWRLENQWLDELSERSGVVDSVPESHATEGMRTLAAADPQDPVFGWVASHSTREQLLSFLAADGLADDRLEDLFAATLMGLQGPAKSGLALELANELGSPGQVEAHTSARAALGLDRPIEISEQSESALERLALPGLMTTNHWLQPEAIGFLTMRALQSGARAERVVHALKRHRAPSDATNFYRMRAEQNQDFAQRWLQQVVRPASKVNPDWSHRMIRGARWRLGVNAPFYAELHAQLRAGSSAAARKAA